MKNYYDEWEEEQSKWPQSFPKQTHQQCLTFCVNAKNNLEDHFKPPSGLTVSECIQELRARFFITLKELHKWPIHKPDHNYRFLKGEVRIYRTKKNIRYDIAVHYSTVEERVTLMIDHTPYPYEWQRSWFMMVK